jgi:hypothetical protein
MTTQYKIGKIGSLHGVPHFECSLVPADDPNKLADFIDDYPSVGQIVIVFEDHPNVDWMEVRRVLSERFNFRMILRTDDVPTSHWDYFDSVIMVRGFLQYNGEQANEVWLFLEEANLEMSIDLPRYIASNTSIWVLPAASLSTKQLIDWVRRQTFPVRVQQ